MLFQKAMVIADCHFGRSANSPQANQDNLDFLAWAIDEARIWGAQTCIMLGDWHDNRNSIGLGTMHASLQGLGLLSDGFDKSYFITGNHDLYFRDRRDIASVSFAQHLPNIVLINNPTDLGGVSFLPWLVQNEHKEVQPSGRYVFAHLELPGFLLNNNVVMPETDHAPDDEQFAVAEWCFTGHFHKRQSKRNICYTGNIMPFNFSDEDDDQRGMMLLEWGKEPVFKSWPDQPLYRAIKLSELLDSADRVLKPKMTLRVSVDIPLGYEEAQEIRETLTKAYDLRKLELNHAKDDVEQDIDQPTEFQTVDQIVIEGLGGVESVELFNERLIEIYQSLM